MRRAEKDRIDHDEQYSKDYTVDEAKALGPDKDRIAKVERLKKIKARYDRAALEYNNAQTKAAEARQLIDKYNAQIGEMEQKIKDTDGELARIQERVELAKDESEKQSFLREQRLIEKKLKKYTKRLKGYRRRLAKAIENAKSKEENLEKSFNRFQDAESAFAPYTETLDKEEKAIIAEQAAIEKALKGARDREQQERVEEKLARRRELTAKGRLKEQAKATKKLERELALMKRERVKKAQQEGRELSTAELEQWTAKEKELRDRLRQYYEESELDVSELPDLDSYRIAKSELAKSEEEFYRIQNEVNQTEKELDLLRESSNDFEEKMRKMERKYNQKTQELLSARGTDRERDALKAARDVEEQYMELTTTLRDYREQETEAIKRALNIKRDLVEAKERLDLAKENYERSQKMIEIRRQRELDEKRYIETLTKETLYPGTAGADGLSFQGRWPLVERSEETSIRAIHPAGKRYNINSILITGDQDVVYALKNWPDYESDALYSRMSDADIEAFRSRLLKDLHDEGYVFATVSVNKQSLKQRFLKFRVHAGEEGDVTVVGNRWYTAKQILDSISWDSGTEFNYRQLYADLYNLNSRPDLRINSKLIPKVDKNSKKTIDIELNVIDRLPLHGALRLSNTGVRQTSDWRLRSTVQHLNLSHRNDIATIEWLTDPKEPQDVNAISASYHLALANRSGLAVYSGWSESNITDVAPDIDIFGEGYYLGAQYSKQIKSADNFNLEATIGWLFQSVENFNEFAGQRVGSTNDVDLSMPNLTLSYSEKNFDKFGGRNFISNTIQVNLAGNLGSSDEKEFQDPNVDGSFVVNRFQFARFQKLFAGRNIPGKWTLFLQFDAQLADEASIPAVQKGFGGVNSVRGYEEREVSADNGFTGSVELQTPLISNFIPTLQRSEEYLSNNPDDWTVHRLQFVGFYDFGRSEKIAPLEGEEKNTTFSSIGAGFRLALTKFSQLSLDYGFPLVSTDESSGGRGHISLQMQF